MAVDHHTKTQNKILSRLNVAGATEGPSLGAAHEAFVVRLGSDGKIHETFIPDSVRNGVNFIDNAAFQSGSLAGALGTLSGVWAVVAGTPSIAYSGAMGEPLHGDTQLEMADTDSVAQRARILSEVPLAEQPGYVLSFYAGGLFGTTDIRVQVTGEDGAGTPVVPDLVDTTVTPPDFVLGKARFEFPFSIDPADYGGGGPGVAAEGLIVTLTADGGDISVDCVKLEVGSTATRWTPDTSVATEDEIGEVLLAPDGSADNTEGFRVVQANDSRLPLSGVVLSNSNAIPDAAFENGTLIPALGSTVGVWAIAAGAPGIAAGSVDDTIHGVNVLRFDANGESAAIRVRLPFHGDAVDYVLSLYNIGGAAAQALDVDITLEDETQVVQQTIATANLVPQDGVWQRSEITFAVSLASFPTEVPTFIVITLTGTTAVGVVEVDALQLELGTVATAWTPGLAYASEDGVGSVLLAPDGDATNLEGNRVVKTDDSRLPLSGVVLANANAIPDAAFEAGTLIDALGSTVGVWAFAAGSVSIAAGSIDDTIHGVNALRFVANGDAAVIRVRLPFNEDAVDYVLSLYNIAGAVAQSLDVDITIEDETKVVKQTIGTATIVPLNGAWQRSEVTFAVNLANFPTEVPTFVKITLTGTTAVGTVEIDALKLELGTVATIWTPGPVHADETEGGWAMLSPDYTWAGLSLGASSANEERIRVIPANDTRFTDPGGGSNLIPDSDFESGVLLAAPTTDLGIWYTTAGTPTFNTDLTNVHSGARAVKLQVPDEIQIRVGGMNHDAVVDPLTGRISQTKSWCLSFHLRGAGGLFSSVDIDATVEVMGRDGVTVLETPVAAVTTSAGPPAGLSYRAAIPFEVSTGLYAQPPGSFRITFTASGGGVASAYLDCVQLESGRLPTPWMPHRVHASETALGEVFLAPDGDATNLEGNRVVRTDDSRLVQIPLGIKDVLFVDSPYTVLAAGVDDVIYTNAVGGAIVLDLPTAATSTGRVIRIKKIDAGGFSVTINPSGAELIEGVGFITLLIQYEAVTIICDGTEWWIH